MEVQELLERISEEIRVDMADFISVREVAVSGPQPATLHSQVYFDWNKALRNGKTHLIREITWNRYGHPCVKLVDSQAALRTMAQIRGLLHEPEKVDDPRTMASAIAALMQLPKETLHQLHLATLGRGAVVDIPARVITEEAPAGR